MKVRFQRAELHNHTTESDGKLTVSELMNYAAEEDFGVIALTDHNTVSGHEKAEETIRREKLPLSLICGVEATTFYGHILALGTSRMTDLMGLNPQTPEEFFLRLRRDGASVIGLAHPNCIGRPAMAGCRFDMEIHNWDLLDYMEVFNTSAGVGKQSDALIGNDRTLSWWEDLVLSGHRLAAVAGKDLHSRPKNLPYMRTYAVVPEEDDRDAGEQVIGAICRQKTFVTRGPLVNWEVRDGNLFLWFDQTLEYFEWNHRYEAVSPRLWMRDDTEKEREYLLDWSSKEVQLPLPDCAHAAVLRLYDGECDWENLLTAGICVRW
ncbi:MAG: CehA/McbA family metallohydrolase [Lachnospiraceae bacterium]|nr:CehA/McbA family metallohydrolase [Lachnospiraceae bacterium]